MRELWAQITTFKFFKQAIQLAVIGHLLDILLTLVDTKLLGGCEQNPFLVNMDTCGLLVFKSILVKTAFVVCLTTPVALALRYTTKNWFVAALPFLYEAGYMFWQVDGHNLAIIVLYLLRNLRS